AIQPDEHLTSLGKCLATLPVEPTIGKALIYGILLRCLDPVLTIVSLLSTKSPFVLPLGIARLLQSLSVAGEGVSRVEIAEDGRCPYCGGVLRPLRLDEEEREELRARLLVLAKEKQAAWKNAGNMVLSSLASTTSPSSLPSSPPSSFPSSAKSSPAGNSSSQVISLKALEAWLNARPPFDVVLDAPNIAYYGQNFGDGRFSFRQIDLVLEALKAQGKRAFLTIPVKYTSRKIRDHVLREEGGRGEGACARSTTRRPQCFR
ncbi:hypothetical protein NSK_007764, partial [Nannochloropsis salina CCMP1776]